MNVDPRKFHFIDTRWGFINKRTALSEAKNALQKHGRLYSAPMLELASRQLAVMLKITTDMNKQPIFDI